MGLFSLFRKNKQESASDGSEFLSRAEDESNAARGRGKRRQSKQANEVADPALPEKKRARRRLVGAVALVLAAVIVLPMILDSEPKPLAQDIAIQIPSKDSAVIRPDGAHPGPLSSAGTGFRASASLDKDEELVQPAAAAAPDEKTASLAPVTGTTDQSASIPKPTPKIEDNVAVQSVPSRKPDDSERARALLEGRIPANAGRAIGSSDAKPEPYLVQVAALASPDKVKELQARLKTAGIKSHTQKVATANGEWIRVRVGPFSSKEEADRMRSKIGKLGLNGTLVPA